MLLVTVILAIFVVKPFLVPLLTSLVLAYIFHPVYKWLNMKIKRKTISALIVSLIIILLISIPLGFVLWNVSKEANVSYIVLKQKISKGTLFDIECKEGVVCRGITRLRDWTREPDVRFYMEDSLKEVATRVAEGAIKFAFSLPKRLLDIFLTFFIVFFLLMDGEDIVDRIEKATPLKRKTKEKIFKQMHEVTRAIIYGFFVMAIIQGIIGAIVFSIFGMTSPILWGIVIVIMAFIPFIGPFMIWVPAALVKFFGGSIWSAIGIAVGGIIISSIDTFIKPKVVGDKANIHPILIILGFLGGISLFGIIGLIIGPLILALLITFIKMYIKS